MFVEEQKVPVELEIDEHDEADALHFLGSASEHAVVTARLCIFGEKAKIQRVAVDSSFRGSGYGKDIMQYMIDYVRAQQLAPMIALDAQAYATSFYEALGFKSEGEVFDDAGISHIHMVMKA